ncbi:MAG: DNA polymerase I [Sphingobacteriales bacterium]|nr:DNA polymerase I [Sphingobacteriales bacterium]
MKKTLYLLDAYALIFRAYFAFSRNPLMNSKGMNVSAVSGFTSALMDLLQKEKPTHLAVVADAPGGSFRSVEHEFYKANRQATPEDIIASYPYIRRIVAGFNIPFIEVAGYEADDIIGTLAKKAEQDGFDVYMVTPDKDFGQLVSEHIFIYKPAIGGNPSEILGVEQILQRWDIERVSQVIDMLGLMGDSADNIPGIPGVGEKTAVKLLKEFGNIENLLANTHLLKGSVKEKVEKNKELALISKRLATIVIDAPVEYAPDSYIIEPVNKSELQEVFAELEFRTLARRILDEKDLTAAKSKNGKGGEVAAADVPPPAAGQLPLFADIAVANSNIATNILLKNINNTPHDYCLIDSPTQISRLIMQLVEQPLVSMDTETTHTDALLAELVGLSFSWKNGEAYYVPVPIMRSAALSLLQQFKGFFENENIKKVGQNIKYDILVLKNYNIEVKGDLEDTMILHYVIEPEMRHNLNILSENYLQYQPVPIENLIGKKGKNQLSMRDVPQEVIKEYAAEDADITLQLLQHLQKQVPAASLQQLYQEIEMPIVRVLADMEYEGVAVDVEFLKRYSTVLNDELQQVREQIFEQAGVSFNMDSPKQLGEILFQKMQIPSEGKKTKTGQYATDEETLQELATSYPVAAAVLRYRTLQKLKSTYVDALPALIHPRTGRVHSSFNQAVTSTGRLSSSNPNLQNIPIRTEEGREVRKAFVPRNSDFVLLSADYSQIELRLMAALSQDAAMLEAFHQHLDIHTATAARVFGVALDAVSSDLRRKAKMVNFGIIYGISAFGLAQRLGIPRGEAKTLIEEYFKQYPGVQSYMQHSIEQARQRGYAETILGRRRYLKDLHSRNFTVRGFAERNAINAPIQGSAADMIKIAMIRIHETLLQSQSQARLILQVHDELLLDVPRHEIESVRILVKEAMEQALPLSVPIVAETGIGNNWLEAH